RSGSLRWHPAFVAAGVRAGAGTLESAGHFPVCRGVWSNGASPAGNDPRLWRSRVVRALQMAFYPCAAVSSGSLHSLFLVGPERNLAGGLLLGRLARIDANLWVLSHLRCENRDVRCADPQARFRDVRDLVRHGGSAFAIPAKRHPRHVLHVWRAVYLTLNNSLWPTANSFGGHRSFSPFSPALRTAVDHRAPAQSCEVGSACYEHRVLVVLQ